MILTGRGVVGYSSGSQLRSDSDSDREPANMSCPVGAAWGAGGVFFFFFTRARAERDGSSWWTRPG